MVWPFKKSKVLDFTSGKIPMPKNISKTSGNETVDLTSGDAGLGFLGAMAGSSESDSGLGSDTGLRGKHLKVKVEDIEYKLDSLSRQIGKILDRLDLAEKKIDRNVRLGS